MTHAAGPRVAWLMLIAVHLALFVGAARAQDTGVVFPVGRVEIVYGRAPAGAVPPEQLLSAEATFSRRADGVLTGADPSRGAVRIVLRDLGPSRVERLDLDGMRALLTAVREEVVRRSGTFAYVVPDQAQVVLAGAGVDSRGGSTDLRVLVYSSARRVAPPAPVAPAAAAPVSPSPAAPQPAPAQPAARSTPSEPDRAEPVRTEPARTEPAQTESAPAEQRPASEPASAAHGLEPTVAADGETDDEEADEGRREPAPPARRSTARMEIVSPREVPVSQVQADEAVDGLPIPMTGFDIRYAREHPDLPAPENIGEAPVRLVRVADGFVARDGEGSWVRLGDLGAEGEDRLYGSAIIASMRAIVTWFNDRSVVGVLATPDPDRGLIPAGGALIEDEREAGDLVVPVLVYTPRVTEVSSIASGERVRTEDRLDSRVHRRIRENSPLRPRPDEAWSGDLIRLSPLNAYAHFLSRHPGRQVDVAIANASDPDNEAETLGNADVQYLVQEIKPWTIYFQLSNTGTEETSEWRERFGAIHNQFLGFDDILSLDYITSNFRESHAFIGSYDFPISHDGKLRMNVNGEWTRYRASEVGVADEEFTGRSYAIGSELSFNFFQRDDLFIDVYGGAKYRDIEVINRTANLIGQEEVFVAEAGLRTERRRPEVSFGALAGLSWSINNLTGADESALAELGRPAPDEEWMALVWSSDISFFLDGIASWNRQPPALVHEVGVRFSGQYAFNDRLIPNYEAIGGGLYSARGYPESVVAGDNAVLASFEYRFHLPRAFPADDSPPTVFGSPFRVSPDGGGGLPDWDLIFKTFLDLGRVTVNRALTFEQDEALMSTGVGVELVIANNVSFRTDWGIVLDEAASNTPDPVEVGDSRFHFVLTVLY